MVSDGNGSVTGIWTPGAEDERAAATAYSRDAGVPLYARRLDYDGVPATLSEAGISPELDRGTRLLITVRPGRGSRPAHLASLAAGMRDAGLDAAFAIWPEMHRALRPAQYQVLAELYVPAVHAAGYAHIFCVSNFAAIARDALEKFWPGRDYADGVSVAFYPTGLSLRLAGEFAYSHGVPFGLAEFGVPDGSRNSLEFLTYIREVFADMRVRGVPSGDLFFLHGVVDGTDFRTSDPGVTAAYARILAETTT